MRLFAFHVGGPHQFLFFGCSMLDVWLLTAAMTDTVTKPNKIIGSGRIVGNSSSVLQCQSIAASGSCCALDAMLMRVTRRVADNIQPPSDAGGTGGGGGGGPCDAGPEFTAQLQSVRY